MKKNISTAQATFACIYNSQSRSERIAADQFYRWYNQLADPAFEATFLRIGPLPPQRLKEWERTYSCLYSSPLNFTSPLELDYPEQLRNIPDSPYFLSYLGDPIWLNCDFLAVVGSREPSDLSEKWLEQELASFLTHSNCAVVSGGARGIDQLAHRLCIRKMKPTLAVIPSGLRNIYPSNFESLIESILKNNGCIVSEYSPDTSVNKSHFSRRNRIISGLALGTLLVDAKERSGTLITARHSLEQGRPIWVLPSHPFDLKNRGALNLLMEGATPVRDGFDLLSYVIAEEI